MWLFSRSKRTSLVIALHDGFSWRARQFHFHHGQWHAEGMAEAASRNSRKLPKQILEFSAQSDARRLRVLLTGDLHSVTMDLPEDAEKEEIHTALVYEAAGEIGIEAHLLRLAAVRADRFQMGGEPNVILNTGYDARMLETFAQDCERSGLEFDGAGSLELAVLARHARLDEGRRLLFLRRQTGMYVVPAFDASPFQLSAVPFGAEPDETEAGRERAERAGRRFETHRGLPLRIVSCEPLSEARMGALRELLGKQEQLDILPLAEIEEDVLRHVAWSEVGSTEAGCALVGAPPKPRDPNVAGTYLCLALILFTGMYVGLRWHHLEESLRYAKTRETDWKNLLAEREKAKNELQSAEGQYRKVQDMQKLLSKQSCLPDALLPVLDTLAFEAPKYSRITGIAQLPDGSISVTGVTRWQEGLRLLDEAFNRRGLSRVMVSETAAERDEQHFEFKIKTAGAAK